MPGPGAKSNVILFFAGALFTQPLWAGSVIINQAPPVATSPVIAQEDAQSNPMNVFLPAGFLSLDPEGLFQYSGVTLHPHVSYVVQDSTGINYAPGNNVSVVSQEFSPGLTADLGRHWTVDYTPTFNYFSVSELKPYVDQSGSINGVTHYEDWDLSFSQTLNSSSDPVAQTSAQTDQQAYATTLSAGYAFNDHWEGSFQLSQDINLVSGFQNSYTWQTTDGATYNFSPTLNAGFSVGAGYTAVSGSSGVPGQSNPDIVNELFQLTGGWRITHKTSIQASVGLSDQQYLAAGYGDSLSPIFGLTLQWQPFKDTQVSLSANRTTGASDYYVEAQSMDTTTVGLTLSQQLLVKYNLVLGVDYTRDDYTSAILSQNIFPGNVRTDNMYSFNASFGRSFFKNGSWSITYSYQNIVSSLAGFSQHGNQIGFQIAWSY